ncbi:MAG: hypothetical protein P4M14_02160 [Gammaproteobacteria bacterium]|nr:hypothetical protein [Gammaproteobacteria bacterium]
MSNSSRQFSPYTSGYLFARKKSEYGGKQQDYINETQRIIKNMAEQWHQAVGDKKNLIQLFHETLNIAGQERNQLAAKHHTQGAASFGKRSDQPENFGGSPFTPLVPLYEEYNKRVLADIQNYLKKMPHTPAQFKQTELKEADQPCLGHKASTEVLIMTFEEIKKHIYTAFGLEDYVRLCELCGIAPIKETTKGFNLMDEIWNLTQNKETMQTLKQKSIDEYKKLKLFTIISDIKKSMGPHEKKTDWVLVTKRLEVEGKMYALSQYITWLNRDLRTDPVTRMLDHSEVAIIHQDVFLIEKMLASMAKQFEKIINWNGANQDELQNMIALFQYEFSHAMPFMRGSAAVGEWFETAMYRFHGLEASYNNQHHINLEALVSSLKDFVQRYPSFIKLEKLPTPDTSSAAKAGPNMG